MLLKFLVRSSAVVHKLWLVEHFQIAQMEASSGKVLSCAGPEEAAAGAAVARSAGCGHSRLGDIPVPPQPSPWAAAEQELRSL